MTPTTTKTVSTHPTHPTLVLCELAPTGIDGLESFSPFCLKIHRALRLAALPYERRHGATPDAFRTHNPAGQVPVLLVDGAPVSDSTNILLRVDALSGGALTGHLGDEARAEAWLWEELGDTALNGFLVAARWADERNWPLVRAAYFGDAPWLVRKAIAPRVRARVLRGLVARDVLRAGHDACVSRFLTALNNLDRRAPRSGFWVSAEPSVADVAIFAQLHSLRTHLTRFQADQIALRPRLTAYLDRVDAATARASLRPTPATSKNANGASTPRAQMQA